MPKNLLSPFFSFPGVLPYAEIHYKFKLPWSPLYKRWPEIFVDGPRFCVPGVIPKFYLVIKDAFIFPVKILQVKITLQHQGNLESRKIDLNLTCESELEFVPLPIAFPQSPGKVLINALIQVENKTGRRVEIFNSNLTGLNNPSLELDIFQNMLPYPPDWQAGDLHCHSDYSNDQVEFGAPHAVLQQVAGMLGLGFVITTDHSYEFQYNKTQYLQPVDPIKKWQCYREDALSLNHSPNLPIMIPGEEVSCANAQGRNVHLLVLGCPDFIPGQGDGGRRWLNNRPDLPIKEVLERCKGYPAYAAHPKHTMSFLERKLFRRGVWNAADIPGNAGGSALHGLQFWNGYRGREFSLGRSFWVSQLLRGRRLLPAGANDAHGDFNRYTGVKTPLFTLFQSLNHIFGNVRTLVRSNGETVEDILAGLKNGSQLCTDGPFINLAREGGHIHISGKSISEFGALEKIHLFTGQIGNDREKVVKSFHLGKNTFDLEEKVPLPAGISYFRAEAWTDCRRLAITSPLWEY